MSRIDEDAKKWRRDVGLDSVFSGARPAIPRLLALAPLAAALTALAVCLTGDPRPDMEAFLAAQLVADRRADRIEDAPNLRCRLGKNERNRAENEHTKDETLGGASALSLS